MESLKLEKKTAKKLYPEAPVWFQKVLNETFGSDMFRKTAFDEIKTFEDACDELGIEIPSSLFSDSDTPDEIAYKKLKVIFRAINQGWEADWSNKNQKKWWPWFTLSSGFGFSDSHFGYDNTFTGVGSRLCFESEKKSDYAAKQFIDLYEQFLTIKK